MKLFRPIVPSYRPHLPLASPALICSPPPGRRWRVLLFRRLCVGVDGTGPDVAQALRGGRHFELLVFP